MDSSTHWLEEAKSRATLIAEAYRLSLSRLWVANLFFVVAPAVCSTAAAVFAAAPSEPFEHWVLPPASWLAGLAAVLVAVHKALRCEEFQAECLRLEQMYQGIADAAGAALARDAQERPALQEQLAKELRELTESARARLATSIIARAEKRCGVRYLPKPASSAA